MEPINEVHVAEPGLAVIDVAAADAATALALQEVLAAQWATATADHVTHEPGEPGVRLRCYLDLRQPLRPRSDRHRTRQGSQQEPKGHRRRESPSVIGFGDAFEHALLTEGIGQS
ncbi:DUF6207 family protein [Streptomyces chartreusis]|uniref:DUF6207 family protein n=1 Tax=Streptomyces chartreusis TaxID=1969 RepID=UPI00365FAE45